MRISPAVPTASLDGVVGRALEFPDRLRVFDLDVEHAARRYRIPRDVLARLIELGMPSRGTVEHLLVDRLDIENVAIELPVPSPQRSVMRGWAAAIERSASQPENSYTIQIRVDCANPEHGRRCDLAIDPVLLAAAERCETLSHGVFRAVFAARPRYRPVSSLIDAVADMAQELTFRVIERNSPPRQNGPIGRFADCRTATSYIADRCRAEGIPARAQTGLLVITPFPMPHYWIEVLVDEEWVAIDPFMVKSLVEWGILDGSQWSIGRTLSPVLVPISTSGGWEVGSHNGCPVPGRMQIVAGDWVRGRVNEQA